jgi:hypothetical protein
MKAIKILPTNSKSVKKCMTLYGIKVRRCVKNGNGLLISVQNTEEDIKLAQNFFNEFNMTRSDGNALKPICQSDFDNIADFGNVFHTRIYETI